MLPKSVVIGVVIVVSLMFAANFFAQFVISGYRPDPAINGLFGTLVTSTLFLTRRSNDSRSDGTPDTQAEPGIENGP
jgi:hypothetical protein